MTYLDKIKTTNVINEVREELFKYLEKIKKKEKVIGIVLLGGVADSSYRRFLDKYSDIDIAIFLDVLQSDKSEDIKKFSLTNQKLIPEWLPEFSYDFPVNNELKLEINIHQLFLQYESKEQNLWSESKKEAYLYTGEIYYDPTNKISELIEKKTRFDLAHRKERIITLAGQKSWYIDINPLIQIERGYHLNAHQLLNKGLDNFIECLYLYNKKYRPHDKWLLEIAQDLEWTPNDFKEKLYQCYLIFGIDKEDILRRKLIINEMWSELLEVLNKEGLAKDPFYFTSIYIDPDRQALEYTIADKVSNKFENLEDNIINEIKSLINFNLPKNYESFKEKVYNKDFSEEENKYFKNSIKNLYEKRNNI